jgi:hypothetical protein
MRSRSHLGIGFELWSSQRVWFWSVVNPRHNGGAIGAATTEAEAVGEACAAIEEMSAPRRFASQARACQRDLSVRLSPVKFDCPGRERLAGVGWRFHAVSNFCL